MDGLALYLLKSAVCNAVFLVIYTCFLKNKTFFRFNRYYLITGIFLSVLLPLYTYTYEVTLTAAELSSAKAVQTTGVNSNVFWSSVFLAAYGLGIVFLVGRYLFGLLKIKAVINRAGFSQVQHYRLVHTKELKSSFSAYNYIFIDSSADLSETERQLILAHEIAHVRQYHWADLLLTQLFCTLQWFNPLSWLYRKAIRENHEYLADQAVLQQGTSAAVYRAVLVNQCIGTQVFSFSSSFYQYDIPRLNMLSRPSSGSVNKAAVVLILPAIGAFYMAFSETLVTIKAVSPKSNGSTPVHFTISGSKAPAVATFSPNTDKRLTKRVIKPSLIAAKGQAATENTNKVSAQPAANTLITTSSSIHPLYLLDGVEVSPNINDIDKNTIAEIRVLKDEAAIKEFGERGRNGVIMIYTKTPLTIP